MAAPTISSAVNNSGVLTVGGSNFGTKSTPAPYFYQPFTGLSVGDLPTDAGFDSYINRGAEKIAADGVAGGWSLRCDPGSPPGSNNQQPHIGKYLPDGNQKVRCSFWIKVYGDSTSGIPFFKFARAGKRSGGDPHDDYDSSDAKFYPTIAVYDHGVIGENAVHGFFRNAGGEISGSGGVEPWETVFGNDPVLPQVDVDINDWKYLAVIEELNTLGVADGRLQITTDTYRQMDLDEIELKTDSAEDLSFIQPITHFEGAGDDYDYAYSRMFIDVGPDCEARVELINASTTAGMTAGPIELEIVSWDTDLVVNMPASIPSGYDYVRVTNAAGEYNTTAFAYTDAGGGSFQPAWARNSNQVIVA